jgi:hypothetical protein
MARRTWAGLPPLLGLALVGCMDREPLAPSGSPLFSGGVGTCTVQNTGDVGTNSLRAHIADPSCAVINFGFPSGTIVVETPLTVSRTVTIDGPAGAGVIVAGSNSSPTLVFHVTGEVDVTIDRLQIRGGKPLGAYPDGGGILMDGGARLWLKNSVVAENEAGRGGGIYMEGFTATRSTEVEIWRSTIEDNLAPSGGGGVFVSGFIGGSPKLTVVESTIRNNKAIDLSGGGHGGGIFSGGILEVRRSTISGNEAGSVGGAIAGSAMDIENSTLSGNTSKFGGAIYAYAGNVVLRHATVAFNHSTWDDDVRGGAIYWGATAPGGLQASGSVIALNTHTVGVVTSWRDLTRGVAGGSAVSTNSIIGTPGSPGWAHGISNGVNGNLVLTPPDYPAEGLLADLLGSLAGNGGPTETHALPVGSLAIDHVPCSAILVDQRWYSRPGGGMGNCDAGAFESGGVPLPSDGEAPVITITAPAHGADYLLGSSVTADYGCVDETGGTGLASCTGPVANGTAIAMAPVGVKTFTVEAADNAGNTSSKTSSYRVVYNFSGFFPPASGAQNTVKAGSAVPIKFSLGGNQGMNVLMAASPASRPVNCQTGVPTGTSQPTAGTGKSSLSYTAGSGQYQYNWKTEKEWKGSCREFQLVLNDGTTRMTVFRFN